MKSNIDNRTILNFVAVLLLAALVFRTFVNPPVSVSAQQGFSGVQYLYNSENGEIHLWDTRTGDIYVYLVRGRALLTRQYRVKSLGKEIELVCGTQGDCAGH